MGNLLPIGLQARVPTAPENPIEQQAKVVQLKSLLQQQQMNAYALEQAKREQEDLDKWTQAYSQAGGDPDKAVQYGMKAGVSPKILVPFQEGILKRRKESSDLDSAELTRQIQKNSALAAVVEQADALPDDQYLQAWPVIAGRAKQIDPTLQINPAQPIDKKHLKLIGLGLKSLDQIDKEEDNKRQEQTAQETQRHNLAMESREGNATQEDKAIADYLGARNLEDTAVNRDKARRALKLLVPTFNFNLQSGAMGFGQPPNGTGEAALAKVGPQDAGTVRALATGRISLPSSFALRTPYWQRILGILNQYDPEFSEQRAQVRKAFTTGPDGKNIGNLNTATVHLDALGEASKALSNGQFVPGNQTYNYVQTLFGGAAPTNFNGIKNAAAGEIAAALKGNATDIEIHSVAQDIANKNSPQQLSEYIGTMMGILHQKLTTYKERYEQQIPGDTLWSPILPQAEAVFQKHGIQEGASSQQSPQSMGGPAPKSAAEFLKKYQVGTPK